MPNGRRRQHFLIVEVLTDRNNTQGQRQMQDRLHRWLETYGHTASSFGFQFVSVGVMTGKRLKDAPSMSNERE